MNGHHVVSCGRYVYRPPMGKNAGSCARCGHETGWRSVHNLCWPCKSERSRLRRPLYVDPEILFSSSFSEPGSN